MVLPLMPKATAVWLVDNTGLTFEQIAEFCGMHSLEISAIADGEVDQSIMGLDPVAGGQLTLDEIRRCEADSSARLTLADTARQYVQAKNKGARYTPMARRQDKPDAIAWLVKNYPALADSQIIKLIGTTKSTIQAVREKTHWNSTNIKPRDPVLLGLCTQTHLDMATAHLVAPSQESSAAAD